MYSCGLKIGWYVENNTFILENKMRSDLFYAFDNHWDFAKTMYG